MKKQSKMRVNTINVAHRVNAAVNMNVGKDGSISVVSTEQHAPIVQNGTEYEPETDPDAETKPKTE